MILLVLKVQSNQTISHLKKSGIFKNRKLYALRFLKAMGEKSRAAVWLNGGINSMTTLAITKDLGIEVNENGAQTCSLLFDLLSCQVFSREFCYSNPNPISLVASFLTPQSPFPEP